MRLGVSLATTYDEDDPRVAARWLVERAAAARDAELDSLFVGDHHAESEKLYYQNVPLLGRLLGEWRDRPVGSFFVLPLWHPVMVAEHVGTLASLTTGRFIIQCAIGYGGREFEAMGVDSRHRPSLMEAHLDVVRRLLAGDEVTATLPERTIREARFRLIPPDPVEIWIGGHARPAIERAAALGDGWMAGPKPSSGEVEQMLRIYLEARDRRSLSSGATAVRRFVYVGKSRSDARSKIDAAVASGQLNIDPAAVLAGGTDDILEATAAYADMGFSDVIVRHIPVGQNDVLGSFERLAEVRQALAAQYPSQ